MMTKVLMLKLSCTVAGSLIFLTTGATTHAEAANFSFQSSLSTDDDIQLFNFTVDSTSDVILKTLSYAGGTQADGTSIPDGGFDPILAVFDDTGNFIDSNDDGNPPFVPVDPTTGESRDSYLELTLAPGNYTVAISQYDNFFKGSSGDNISLGFFRQGEGNFTAGLCPGTATQFCDLSGDERTGELAVDVLNVDNGVAIPEPLTVLGTGSALGFGAFFKRKLTKLSQKDK